MTASTIISTAPNTYSADIAGTNWQNITVASRFWSVVQDAIAAGEPVGVPSAPSSEEVLAAKRAAASIDRGALCKALKAAGILSASGAIIAAKGDWPTEFATFLAGLDADGQFNAQVDWAAAMTVRYGHPLLQAVALAYAGNEAQATALLDQLFGIAAE